MKAAVISKLDKFPVLPPPVSNAVHLKYRLGNVEDRLR
jgi:hypothetical protein